MRAGWKMPSSMVLGGFYGKIYNSRFLRTFKAFLQLLDKISYHLSLMMPLRLIFTVLVMKLPLKAEINLCIIPNSSLHLILSKKKKCQRNLFPLLSGNFLRIWNDSNFRLNVYQCLSWRSNAYLDIYQSLIYSLYNCQRKIGNKIRS